MSLCGIFYLQKYLQKFNSSIILIALGSASVFTGCLPQNDGVKAQSQLSNNKGTGSNQASKPGTGFTSPTNSSGNTVEITNVRVLASGSTSSSTDTSTSTSTSTSSSTSTSTTSVPVIQLFFRSDLGNGTNLDQLCNPSGSSGSSGSGSSTFPCLCRFSWQEINSNTGSGYTRTVDTSFTQVTAYSATCNAPAVWNSEIPEGKQITITVKADAINGNTNPFTSNSATITKTSSVPGASNGDFRDSEGKAIKNIYHYVCHDYLTKALGIEHDQKRGTDRQGTNAPQPPMVSLANRFRVTNLDFSAQNYWYDFYIRSDDPGQIRQELSFNGSGYRCPLVNTTKGTTTTARPFPLDSTFALALQTSKTYPVSVPANIRLSSGGTGAVETGILGYAAKPAADGTCPSLPDSNGLIRRMFRLRRYVVNYPLRYDATGRVLGGGGAGTGIAQPTNTIYILDRPVDRTGQNPLKPLTRLGPKPCPFSWVNTRQFTINSSLNSNYVSYSCTTPSWKFPKFILDQDTSYTSATGLPGLYGWPDGSKFGLITDSSGGVRGYDRTYCLPNGSSSGAAENDSSSSTCAMSQMCRSNPGACGTAGAFNDFVSTVNIDGTAIQDKACPIYPPPAWNLSVDGSLPIKPVRGFVPEFLEDAQFQACAFQSSQPVDPDLVVAYNSYQKRPGDRDSDDPKKARGFYCARVYPDAAWIAPPPTGSGFNKTPGNCDSGRPKYSDPSFKYFIPKSSAGAGATYSGYANVKSSPTSRTVPDGLITSYSIMNERTYACAFTYNTSVPVPYSDRNRLTDLVTPRSGCCQRCSGPSKSGNCSRIGAQATPENRGVHSIVPAHPSENTDKSVNEVNAFYNRYGLPAFTMQAVLLTGAPFQLTPNKGALRTDASCYAVATGIITGNVACHIAGTAIATGSNNGGVWTNETTGTPLGCYDPSEDP